MRLLKAHVVNFKLLQDVEIDFSTDPSRPLTVVRGDPGSGKTSLLFALKWAFFGMRGLPAGAQVLISSRSPVDEWVEVQVSIDFEEADGMGGFDRFVVARSSAQRLRSDGEVEDGATDLQVVQHTSRGVEPVHPALLENLLPTRLRNVFFTNGDEVQTFIEDGGDSSQELVLEATNALLGLDEIRLAAEDLEEVAKKARRAAANKAGADVAAVEADLSSAESELAELSSEKGELSESLRNMRETKVADEAEMQAIRGIGDLDRLNSEIAGLSADLEALAKRESSLLKELRDTHASESASWLLMDAKLSEGLSVLEDLSDRRVIPGISLQVLHDRLELGECVCGECLLQSDPAGSVRRDAVLELIEQQKRNDDRVERLTQTNFVAQSARSRIAAEVASGGGAAASSMRIMDELSDIRRTIPGKSALLDSAKSRRGQIEHVDVKAISDRIHQLEIHIGRVERQLGELDGRINLKSKQIGDLRKALDDAVKAQGKRSTAQSKRDAAEDLLLLAKGTLSLLQTEYVQRVGSRMSEIFMEIVGADPDAEAGVFSGVHIDPESFNIVVESGESGVLRNAFEINGASLRALTLSFIRALTEVSRKSAPRVIDTPLGMVAGGTKRRMAGAMTRPAVAEEPEFQVVLLLSSAEIRDIEQVLDERGGSFVTLSCSKDFPADLRFNWGADRPLVRACRCDHRHSCRICARNYDAEYGIEYVDSEEGLG